MTAIDEDDAGPLVEGAAAACDVATTGTTASITPDRSRLRLRSSSVTAFESSCDLSCGSMAKT
jgi:hypothetical protein